MSHPSLLLARVLCSGLVLLCATQQVSYAAKPQKAAKSVAKPHKVVKTKVSKAVPVLASADNEFTNFTQWREVTDFMDMMVSKHQFERATLERTLKDVQYIDTAVKLVRPAPAGKAKNWAAYRMRFVEPIRINAGLAFWQTHADALARAESTYGVPAEIIVSIIGVETVFGRNTGNFRVMDVVTTLAFAYPEAPKKLERKAFFRGELENTLLLARESDIDPFSLRGSYAGAIGLPQFMPSSIRNFGIDFDVDGKLDLRNSAVDAIGSVAHFLQEHGWRKDAPLVYSASVTQSENPAWLSFINQGLEAKFTLHDLQKSGVSFASDVPEKSHYGLIDLQNGNYPTEYWLGSNNFFAITKYNRSYFYAMSVIELGKAIKNAKKQ